MYRKSTAATDPTENLSGAGASPITMKAQCKDPASAAVKSNCTGPGHHSTVPSCATRKPLWNRYMTKTSRTHTCRRCNARFTRPNRFIRHVKAVHRSIRIFFYRCKRCTAEFPRRRLLKSHITQVHV
mmetsp:Transcript_9145/g.22792  ORF Transcript_9145/g.22792 Transcript_9145/m.22792 type:complete len:127 (-) Transcript_9145:272-652(-)